jgi:hypothetical protein
MNGPWQRPYVETHGVHWPLLQLVLLAVAAAEAALPAVGTCVALAACAWCLHVAAAATAAAAAAAAAAVVAAWLPPDWRLARIAVCAGACGVPWPCMCSWLRLQALAALRSAQLARLRHMHGASALGLLRLERCCHLHGAGMHKGAPTCRVTGRT